MLCNFSIYWGVTIEYIQKTKLLGFILTEDLRTEENTRYIEKKAYMRIWYIKRLLQFGVQVEDLIAVYVRQIRSVCEFAVRYWGPMITQGEVRRLEKIQRTVLHVILGNKYTSYREALLKVNLETLEERRKNLCIKFAAKTSEQQKFRHWFERNSEKCNNTRSVTDPWKLPKIRTDRL